MKTLSLRSLLALTVLLPSVGTQDSITFQARELEVGDQRVDRGSMSMNMEVEVSLGGKVLQSMEQSQSEDEELRTTLLAMDGDQVTKVELHCTRKVTSQSGPAGEQTLESPLTGKTVVALWNGGDVQVVDLEGNAVSAELREAAIAETGGTFDQDDNEFANILPDRPIAIGETITVDDETAQRVFSGDSTLDEIEMTLTLQGRKQVDGQDCGLFAVVLSMKGEASEGVKVATLLTGELLLGIETTWPHRMMLEGEMEVDGQQGEGEQAIGFSGTGPMRMERSASYTKVK